MKITKHQHVVPRQEGWAVKVADGERASKVFQDRNEAIEYAKNLSRKHNVCMVVHDESSKFKEFQCNPELLEKGEEGEECAPAGYNEEMSDELDRMSEKKIPASDEQVFKKNDKWAVVTNNGTEIKTFKNKGYAMLYAYRTALQNNSCMLMKDENGDLKATICPPDESPGIIEVIRMNTRL